MRTVSVRTIFVLSLAMASAVASAEIGVTDQEIKLGTSFPLSGSFAATVTDFRLGSDTYIEKINEAGGIHGRKIKIIIYDDQYEPVRAVANTEKLIDPERVFALYNYFGTRIAKVVINKIKALDIPFVAPIAASYTEFSQKPVKNSFFLKSPQEDLVRPVVLHAVRELKLKEIGIFYQYDETGIPGRSVLIQALKENGLKMTGDGQYSRDSDEDIQKGFDAIFAAKPKAVVLVTAPKTAANFIKRCAEKNYKPIILGASINASMGKDLEKQGFESYFALTFPLSYETNFPLVADFRKDMQKHGDAHINESSIQGYIAARLLVKALEDSGRQLTRKKLIDALEKMKNYDMGGVHVSLSETSHEAVKTVFVVKEKDGKLVRVDR